MAEQNKKVKRYRKPLNLNIGMLIFAVIFVYVIFCVVMYFQTSHIIRYEVKKGSLATDSIYRGVIIRDETVVTAESAGYVNFYVREGERVAKNNLVYTIDESGRLNQYLESLSTGENILSEKELAEFRNEVVNFKHGFEAKNFNGIYEFKESLNNTVQKLANENMLETVRTMNTNSEIANLVRYCNAPATGIVANWVDGYENLSPDMVTEDIFDEDNYSKTDIFSNELIETGEAIYKISTNENWSVVIPIENDFGVQLEEMGYVKVRFLKNQYESWGATKLLRNSDGKTYIQLSFTNSMITFIKDRFVDIELQVYDETGLKIPNSSIVTKEFYLIPEEFVTQSGKDDSYGVIRQCYLEDGTISSEFIATDVYSYSEDSGEYYVDTTLLSAGDILYKTDSQATYTVSRRATLLGVYNMNKGYADFKEIVILYQNDEYAVVKSNTKYGLNVYDYIVLDASAVSDDQFINK